MKSVHSPRTARMPATQQARLNSLIDKSKSNGLSAAEQRELETMLQEVDRRSFWLLARKMLNQRGPRSAKAS